jgi:hypothetical protein
MASFSKAVGGCPVQHRIGTARLGLKSGLDHPGRRRGHGALHPRADGARGRRHDGHPHRSAAPHRARDPGRARRQDLPADLLPRGLRRHGARRGRHRRGLHRLRGRGRGHGHAFLAREHGRGPDEGDPHRPGPWAESRVRRRLPPEPLGPHGARCGRGALQALRDRDRAPEGHPAPLRPRRRHGGGAPHRGRVGGHARNPAGHPRGLVRHHRVQARADGLRGVSGPHPGFPRRRHPGSGLPGRGLQRARRRRRVSLRLPARLAPRRAARDLLRLRQCERGFAVSRLLCSPEIPTFAELQHFLAKGSPHRALRHDAALNHIHWATTRRPRPRP